MRNLIENGPFKLKNILDPNSPANAPREIDQIVADRTLKEKDSYYTEIKARNHDLLALVAIASPLYSQPSQSYYVTHPLSMHDYDDDYQGESKNVRYTGNCSRNAGRITGNQGTNIGNGFAQKNVVNDENVQRNSRTTSNNGKKTTEKMLLATKDEAGIHLDEEENDFMLLSASGDD
ncbi:hypothetical protein Tco_0733956 [Tanacetum coccineum]